MPSILETLQTEEAGNSIRSSAQHLINACHDLSIARGGWKGEEPILVQGAMLELAEEALRNARNQSPHRECTDKEHLSKELTIVAILIFDLAGDHRLNLGRDIANHLQKLARQSAQRYKQWETIIRE